MLVSPNQIVVGAGTEYLYSLIVQLLGRNSVFAIEDPGYKKIAKVYRCNGVRCETIGVDDGGLSVSELRCSDANIAHITLSPFSVRDSNAHQAAARTADVGKRK